MVLTTSSGFENSALEPVLVVTSLIGCHRRQHDASTDPPSA
jgi:hypothetical protein